MQDSRETLDGSQQGAMELEGKGPCVQQCTHWRVVKGQAIGRPVVGVQTKWELQRALSSWKVGGSSVPIHTHTKGEKAPQLRREYPLNLSISLSGDRAKQLRPPQ